MLRRSRHQDLLHIRIITIIGYGLLRTHRFSEMMGIRLGLHAS
jgi:hypothetical protein